MRGQAHVATGQFVVGQGQRICCGHCKATRQSTNSGTYGTTEHHASRCASSDRSQCLGYTSYSNTGLANGFFTSGQLGGKKLRNLNRLVPSIERLRDGLDTALSATGWPLSFCETMQLKLAAALLQRPRVIVLSLLYDMVDLGVMNRILDALRGEAVTLVCFTNRAELLRLERRLWLGNAVQVACDTPEQFTALRDAALRDAAGAPPPQDSAGASGGQHGRA